MSKSGLFHQYSMDQQLDTAKVIDITEENFDAEFPNIQKVVFESAFVALDMEFSGLEVKKLNKAVEVDSVLFFLFSFYFIVRNSLL